MFAVGNFNAHLGPMWGPRPHKTPNVQGVLLSEVLNGCKLVSLGAAISGPNYTYLSGNSLTTVDYILPAIEASACIECCKVNGDTNMALDL